VQLLPLDQPEPTDTRPFGFLARFVKGEIAVDLQRCLDQGERVAVSMSRFKDGVGFEINGKRNSLGKSAVWADFHLKTAESTAQTRTALFWLEPWAADGRTLYLDLSPKYYSRPGKLRVWMLRDDDTVWMETIAWPGMPGAVDETAVATSVAPRPAGSKARGKAENAKEPPGADKAAPATGASALKRPSKQAKPGPAEAAGEESPFESPGEQ